MSVHASQVPIGFEIPSFERRITRRMAEIHGAPMKNFHTVIEEARALGFDDLVVAGPMFTCFFSEMFTRHFGVDWITSGRLEFKLLKPVLANQTIAARAVVRSHEPEAGGTRVGLEIWCERQEDEAHTSVGSASLVLPG
jgi:acyl dehydratase